MALPPARPRPDAREPFSRAVTRCLYPLPLTRFLRAEILAHSAGAVIAETLAAQGHQAFCRALERSYGRAWEAAPDGG
jgi:hypothetical protein